jgi:diadenosine tetraphosphate (Ap4A) HIT family hydrolase
VDRLGESRALMPAPSWTDPDRWSALVDGSNCPLCGRDSGPNVVASLETSLVTTDEAVAVAGYCCIILKDHRVELHQLSEQEGGAFMADVKRVATAVQAITGAIKLNYEVHGNVIPHVHMHIVPRYPGDEIERTGKPFAQLEGPAYRAGEFASYERRLANALKVLAILLAVQACGGEPRPAEEPAIGADTVATATVEAPARGPKACDLLTTADIASVTEVDVVAGKTVNDYMGVSQCRFDRADSTQAIMVSLHEKGDIENYSKVPGATTVANIGDAAVWNPQTNQLAFKRGDAVASISFLFTPAEPAWARSLARLAVPRLEPE